MPELVVAPEDNGKLIGHIMPTMTRFTGDDGKERDRPPRPHFRAH